MTAPLPGIGEWYRHTGGDSFEVVAFDEDDGTIEIQYFDGTVEEMDTEDWESQWADRALEAATASFPNADVNVERDHAPGLPEIQADRQLCEQVFVNLITNAFQAMRAQEAPSENPSKKLLRLWIAPEVSDGEPGVGVMARHSPSHPHAWLKTGAISH